MATAGDYYSYTNTVWREWGYTAASSTTACYPSASNIWYAWNTSSATTTTNYDYAWKQWHYIEEKASRHAKAPALTAAALREIEHVHAERARLYEVRQAEQRVKIAQEKEELKQAGARALTLLLSQLDPSQQATYQEHGYFDLTSEEGHLYRLYKGISGNVKRLDGITLNEVTSYCAHPVGLMPANDVVLAQKLMLECNEHEFLRVANARRVS